MAFSDEDIKIAWDVAKGKCECRIESHNHVDKCGKPLVWDNHGRMGVGCWEAHHLDENPNNDAVGNCGIFCWPCHELTL